MGGGSSQGGGGGGVLGISSDGNDGVEFFGGLILGFYWKP